MQRQSTFGKAISRVGRKPLRYILSVQVHGVHGLPPSFNDTSLSVELLRGSKKGMKTPARQAIEWAETGAGDGDTPLQVPITLYRDPKKGKFQVKPFTLRLGSEGSGKTLPKSLAEFVVDASAFAKPPDSDPSIVATDPSPHLRLAAVGKASKVKAAGLSVVVSCVFVGDQDSLPEDDRGASVDLRGPSADRTGGEDDDTLETSAITVEGGEAASPESGDEVLNGHQEAKGSFSDGNSGVGEVVRDDRLPQEEGTGGVAHDLDEAVVRDSEDDDNDDGDRFKDLLSDVDSLIVSSSSSASLSASTTETSGDGAAAATAAAAQRNGSAGGLSDGDDGTGNNKNDGGGGGAVGDGVESGEGGIGKGAGGGGRARSGSGLGAALSGAVEENEKLRMELEKLRQATGEERKTAERKMARLEDEVVRLKSESMSRVSSPLATSSAGSAGGGPAARVSVSLGRPDAHKTTLSAGAAAALSHQAGEDVHGSLFSLDANDRDATVLELSMAADHASSLPPQELSGQWVTVEGKGLGRVLAFRKEWMPGTDSKHEVEFGGPWGGWGGGSATDSIVETVLLRRPKIRKVGNWGTGAMNGGLLFALAPEPPFFAAAREAAQAEFAATAEAEAARANWEADNKHAAALALKPVAEEDAAAESGGEEATETRKHRSNSSHVDVMDVGIFTPTSNPTSPASSPSAAQAGQAERFRRRSLRRLGSGLPPGWVAALDPTTQRAYYVNEDTGASQWEPPASPSSPASDGDGDVDGGGGGCGGELERADEGNAGMVLETAARAQAKKLEAERVEAKARAQAAAVAAADNDDADDDDDDAGAKALQEAMTGAIAAAVGE